MKTFDFQLNFYHEPLIEKRTQQVGINLFKTSPNIQNYIKMAKKKKLNIFDLEESELKNVSKKIIKETVASPKKVTRKATPKPVKRVVKANTTTTPAPTKPRGKPGPVPKIRTEDLKVLRVRESFHKKAKRMAFDRDIMIQDLIEELILEKWNKINK